MNSDQIAYLALLVSIASLVVSFVSLYRDKHVVQVRAVAVMNVNNVPELNVSVSNSGKRAISINHVLLRSADHPGMYLAFSSNGKNRVDVGESRSCQIRPGSHPITWSTLQELHRLDVYVEDAIGKLHKAKFSGKKRSWSWLTKLFDK